MTESDAEVEPTAICAPGQREGAWFGAGQHFPGDHQGRLGSEVRGSRAQRCGGHQRYEHPGGGCRRRRCPARKGPSAQWSEPSKHCRAPCTDTLTALRRSVSAACRVACICWPACHLKASGASACLVRLGLFSGYAYHGRMKAWKSPRWEWLPAGQFTTREPS